MLRLERLGVDADADDLLDVLKREARGRNFLGGEAPIQERLHAVVEEPLFAARNDAFRREGLPVSCLDDATLLLLFREAENLRRVVERQAVDLVGEDLDIAR